MIERKSYVLQITGIHNNLDIIFLISGWWFSLMEELTVCYRFVHYPYLPVHIHIVNPFINLSRNFLFECISFRISTFDCSQLPSHKEICLISKLQHQHINDLYGKNLIQTVFYYSSCQDFRWLSKVFFLRIWHLW